MSKEEITVIETTSEQVEEVIERPYTLRRLKDADLWPILNIITTVFPDDLTEIFMQLVSKEKKVEELGVVVVTRLVIAVLKNMPKVQDDVYALLADVSGISADAIKEMEFGTTPMMIWDIVDDAKNVSFFKVVSKLL